jgi:hypothetical protein
MLGRDLPADPTRRPAGHGQLVRLNPKLEFAGSLLSSHPIDAPSRKSVPRNLRAKSQAPDGRFNSAAREAPFSFAAA